MMNKPLYARVALMLITGLQPVDIMHKLRMDRRAFCNARRRAARAGLLDYEIKPCNPPRVPKTRPTEPSIFIETPEQFGQWPSNCQFDSHVMKAEPLRYYRGEVASWCSLGNPR
jgi:hypothetical protein